MKQLNYYGRDVPDFLKVTDISFNVIGDANVVEQKKARGAGAHFVRLNRGSIAITITAILVSDERNIMQQAGELKRWLRGNDWNPSPLIFAKMPDRYINAVITGTVDVEDLFESGNTEFTFYASDPAFYAIKENTITEYVNSEITIPIDYKGNEDAPFIATLNIETDIKRIVLQNNNRTLTLDGPFKSGDLIKINTDLKYIEQNGVKNMDIMTLDSRWPILSVNSNAIFVRVDRNDITDGSYGKVELNWRERY